MRYKKFGSTGKEVSVLGFGGMRFDPADEETAVRAIHRAAERGINYFDTAPGYCEGKSEEFLGNALSTLPGELKDGVFVSTKSSSFSDPTADDVRRRIEGQLKALKRDRIAFYNMWCIFNLDHFEKIMAPGGPYEGALRAKEEGLIEHICGSTHADSDEIAAMVRAGVFEGITLGYNILNHEFRKAGMEAAHESGTAVITMNPLGGGMLTRDEEKLSVFKEDESDSFISAAIRFNLSHEEITIVLSGMKNVDEVEANIRTAESVTGPDPDVIGRMIEKFQSLGEAFCTGCRYCLEHCPEGIQIHLYMNLWDRVRMKLPDDARRVYRIFLKEEERWLKHRRASDCTECGECEAFCTQKLEIREYLRNIAEFLGETAS